LRNISNSNYDVHTAVEKWEKAERILSPIFNESLYQIKQWAKSKNGNRSIWKMDDKDRFFEIFKGMRNNNDDEYPFKKYHLGAREFRQIDMPIISGEYFFEDIFFYLDLYKRIEILCREKFGTILKDLIKPRISKKEGFLEFNNHGDKYIYDMMKCTLLFLAVKFGIKNMEYNIVKYIFDWAWILRFNYSNISKETINKYAIGSNDVRINKNLNLFEIISDKTEIKEILEILEIELQKSCDQDIMEKNREIYQYILNGDKNV